MPRNNVAGTASDPTIQFASLEIDGKTYRLTYDFNAIAQAEAASGCNLLQGVAGFLLNTATAAQYRGLLYAALLKAHPKMSIDQAGNLVRIDTMPDIRRALAEAYNLSMPEKKRMDIEEVAAEPEAEPGQAAEAS
jgi:hypothetical protein